MFNKISIIGCGLIGSSILRAVEEKKLASKIVPMINHKMYQII